MFDCFKPHLHYVPVVLLSAPSGSSASSASLSHRCNEMIWERKPRRIRIFFRGTQPLNSIIEYYWTWRRQLKKGRESGVTMSQPPQSFLNEQIPPETLPSSAKGQDICCGETGQEKSQGTLAKKNQTQGFAIEACCIQPELWQEMARNQCNQWLQKEWNFSLQISRTQLLAALTL